MIRCPKCRGKKARVYWDLVVFCPDCLSTSIKDEKRYILVCPKDGNKVAPRIKYKKPTLVCIECLTEYSVPTESSPELIEEVLD